MTVDWRDDLFKESGFWSLYRQTWRIGDTLLNRLMCWGTFLALVGFVLANELYFSRSLLSLQSARASARAWSADGIQFTTQLLGFLVAGFTIFATLTKPEVFEKLAKTTYKNTKLSSLKFIFFNFMIVFIHYISFLAICVVVKTFFGPAGPGTAVIKQITDDFPIIYPIAIYSIFVVLGTWIIVLMVLLKSFVWNVYISVLLVIAVDTTLGGQKSRSSREL